VRIIVGCHVRVALADVSKRKASSDEKVLKKQIYK